MFDKIVVELNPHTRIAFSKIPILSVIQELFTLNIFDMRKKSGLTIVEQAIISVPEFENVVRKLDQQVELRGQSKSTLNNYIRRIALFVVHFGKLPEQIDPEEINEYLVALARDPRSPSRSSFKHIVYGLRYYFRRIRQTKLHKHVKERSAKSLFFPFYNNIIPHSISIT